MLWLIRTVILSIWTGSLLPHIFSYYGAAAQRYGVLSVNEAEKLGISDDEYNIRENYCRLLAHSSTLVEDPDTGELKVVIDGGIALFRLEGVERTALDLITNKRITTKEWHIPDLNPAIAILNLHSNFELKDAYKHMEIINKPSVDHTKPGVAADSDPPIVSRGYLWVDNAGNIYQSGGHFSSRLTFNESRYTIDKDDIPDFRIWKFNIKTKKWEAIVPSNIVGDSMKRLTSSAAGSALSLNTSFAFGGHVSVRTDAKNVEGPRGHGNWATNGMIKYNHTSNRAWNITDPDDKSGYAHGILHHIGPFENHKGFLLVIMAKKYNLTFDFEEDLPGEGEDFDFETIRFFDLESEQWISQKAKPMGGDKPTTRTRFCSVLVREKQHGSWDLWIYGGQEESADNVNNDIFVLTMPAFVWKRVSHSYDTIPTRGHTCHAVGSQMVVLGGHVLGRDPDFKVPCDSGLVKVFDMNTGDWKNSFESTTCYKQFKGLADVSGDKPPNNMDPVLASLLPLPTVGSSQTCGETLPVGGESGDSGDEGGLSKKGIIVGSIIGGVAILVVLAVIFWRKIRGGRHQRGDVDQQILGGPNNSDNRSINAPILVEPSPPAMQEIRNLVPSPVERRQSNELGEPEVENGERNRDPGV